MVGRNRNSGEHIIKRENNTNPTLKSNIPLQKYSFAKMAKEYFIF